jgi:hypothetical protein
MRLNLIPLESLQSDPLMATDGRRLSKPTYFSGTFFRTLNEARFAVLFRDLGIKAVYEDHNVRFGERCAIPDFFLPDLDCYLEVGPYKRPEGDDKDLKCRAMAASSKKPMLLSRGFIETKKGEPPFLSHCTVFRPDGQIGWGKHLAERFPELDQLLSMEGNELGTMIEAARSTKFERLGFDGQPATGVSKKFWEDTGNHLAPVHQLSPLALKLLAMKHCGFRGGWPAVVAKALRCDPKDAAAACRELRSHGLFD